jgi:hypothetical protein
VLRPQRAAGVDLVSDRGLSPDDSAIAVFVRVERRLVTAE